MKGVMWGEQSGQIGDRYLFTVMYDMSKLKPPRDNTHHPRSHARQCLPEWHWCPAHRAPDSQAPWWFQRLSPHTHPSCPATIEWTPAFNLLQVHQASSGLYEHQPSCEARVLKVAPLLYNDSIQRPKFNSILSIIRFLEFLLHALACTYGQSEHGSTM